MVRARTPRGENDEEGWQIIIDSLPQSSRLYAAYGSNMNKAQMSDRCPGAKPIGTTYLSDWKLTMPFYANIEPAADSETPVLIWEISAANEASLDTYEGYPNKYDKTDIVTDLDGKRVSVMVYVMTEKYKTSHKKARVGYLKTIREGYTENGFTESELILG